MQIGPWSRRALMSASLLTLISSATAMAADITDPSDTTKTTNSNADVSAELSALKARIAELEAKENDNWLTDERAAQIRGIVQDVLKDAKTRGQFADGDNFGYNKDSGFYIQTSDKLFKLNVSGFIQVRYEFAQSNATNGRTIPGRTVGGTTIIPDDPGNSSGVDIRRPRITFTGNIFTPDLTYKLEGDFYGNATGNFTVTDAYLAYRFNDMFKVKAGSYKVPFAKAELTSDTNIEFQERAEVLEPFDPIRSLGVSLYGDIIPTKLGYEVAVNNGGTNDNILRRDDTVGLTANIDNRFGYYARVQWAGAGKISDFGDEPDLRTDNRDFIWLLGAAAGYESQNATNGAFPSPQNTTTIVGLSNGNGFIAPYVLNGDLFRGTVDWTAKWQGLSLTTPGYLQQINANPGNTSSTSGTTITTGPFGAATASFLQWGGYGQVGYFIIPQHLELLARVGFLGTEGRADHGEFYSAGADYYIYGHNFKIQSDVTFTPEAAYTDASESLLQNTSDIIYRVQVQLKF